MGVLGWSSSDHPEGHREIKRQPGAWAEVRLRKRNTAQVSDSDSQCCSLAFQRWAVFDHQRPRVFPVSLAPGSVIEVLQNCHTLSINGAALLASEGTDHRGEGHRHICALICSVRHAAGSTHTTTLRTGTSLSFQVRKPVLRTSDSSAAIRQ